MERIVYQDSYFDNTPIDVMEAEYRKHLRANGFTEDEIKKTDYNGIGFCEFVDRYYGSNFYAVKDKLDVLVGMPIIAIANIGMWDGRHTGYKELGSILNSVFNCWDSCDYVKIYLENRNLHGVGVHHDGRNYVTFRKLIDNITENQEERLFEALYDGRNYEQLLKRYTRSLEKDIRRIYGW